MENQPKLNNSKEVIAFLAERFPRCFSVEGEARPLKIGIFQDLVSCVEGELNLSKTQLRSALRMYTSSWRYLHGIKAGAARIDLEGDACGELDEQHVTYARQQLEEAKARVQAQRAEQQAKKRSADVSGQEGASRREQKTAKTRVRRTEGVRQKTNDASVSVAANAKTNTEERSATKKASQKNPRTPVTDISALQVGQEIKVKAGNNAMNATVLEISKDGVRVQLTSGMAMIVRAEHLQL